MGGWGFSAPKDEQHIDVVSLRLRTRFRRELLVVYVAAQGKSLRHANDAIRQLRLCYSVYITSTSG
jgi:hypothetical protein